MIMVLDTTQSRHTIDPGMYERTVTRLSAEFGGEVSRRQVESVLRRCLTDLAGSPVGAMPELSERLARQRLTDELDVGVLLPVVWTYTGAPLPASNRVA
ncbi:three-helix bundle dimerization domain-containing protein [Nocardia sp. NPDC004151]|uniref:three-helix bundle dimerization domain-containing protein n=1 Tax=Nocardia sp. NPDC004151 TaxID=3364304 RepID=UPI00367379E5